MVESRRVPKHLRVSTETSKNPDEQREEVESVRVSKKCPGKYQIRVESV